jgi:hypothetical protein
MWEHGGCSIRCPHGTCVSILDSHSIGHVNVAECRGNWNHYCNSCSKLEGVEPNPSCSFCGRSWIHVPVWWQLEEGQAFAQADSLNFGCESDVFVSSSLIDNVWPIVGAWRLLGGECSSTRWLLHATLGSLNQSDAWRICHVQGYGNEALACFEQMCEEHLDISGIITQHAWCHCGE